MAETVRLDDSAAGVVRAATLLRAGALVSFPTETVYGLGADATNDRAVARIFEAKGRPRFNPLIVHLPDLAAVERVAVLEGDALRLADAFWPGPLTLVLPRRDGSDVSQIDEGDTSQSDGAGLSRLVSGGLETVAVRVPDHGLAHRLLVETGRPVAAPSANPSGRISPTEVGHVLAGLSGRIEAVLDGGTCQVGVESTIVGFTPDPILLRPGGLPVEAIESCLGAPLAVQAEGDPVSAPGQLASHYAPRAQVRLGAVEAGPDERLLGFGPVVGAVLNLSPSGDLVEAAANLFRHLHALDIDGDAPIAVSPIPEHGLGVAINDRLRRAAAPRA